MMQSEKARIFASLHRPGTPLILFNAWDPGSARAVADAGAKAVATGSWSVAAAFGFEDGEKLPLDLAIDNLKRITAAVALPVTIDLEGGYGLAPAEVGATAAKAIGGGAVGCNLQAIRTAADAAGIPFFVNARTDLFLQAGPGEHGALVGSAVDRACAYAEAGASGMFVPGLADEGLIATICSRSPLPVNVMASSATPPARRLAQLGVARISHGPGPYRIAMRALAEAARAAQDGA